MLGAAVSLIPGIDVIQLLIVTQVVKGLLLPIELLTMVWLVNDRALMGRRAKGPVRNGIGLRDDHRREYWHRDLVRGKTLRWTFIDAPTKGTTYEHEFADDGVVHFDAVEAGDQSGHKGEAEAHYGTETVREDVRAVSYKGKEGYTFNHRSELR